MVIFVMFFLEIMTMRYANFGEHDHGHDHDHGHSRDIRDSRDHKNDYANTNPRSPPEAHTGSSITLETRSKYTDTPTTPDEESHHHVPGDDHLGHSRDHRENPETADWEERGIIPETYAAQMTGIFILEFGVIFHSIFIGLTLAVSGAEFVTLYIILTFHQAFEGLGLGARLATVPWPKSKTMTPYILAIAYGLSTPIAIAIGLGIRDRKSTRLNSSHWE